MVYRLVSVLTAGLALGLACREAPEERVTPSAAEAEAVKAPVTPPIELPDGHEAAPGVMVAGQLAPSDIVAARELGYHTIVNLRPKDEDGFLENEASLVEDAGLRYVHIPVHKPSEDDVPHGVTKAKAAKLAEALSAEGALPAIVHCSSANRATALMVLRAVSEGRAPEEALEIADRTGKKKLVPLLEETLGVKTSTPTKT
jgi:uncharacterized protein (TIGR01244 family)